MTRSVLFVCVKNGGKSQMAGALARARGVDLEAVTAGTQPGSGLNEESRAAVERRGATMAGEYPKAMPEDLTRFDRIIVLGTEAHLDVPHEVWDIDEPSLRGITGEQRMDMLADEIDERVSTLIDELGF